jgi:hypothetical protein
MTRRLTLISLPILAIAAPHATRAGPVQKKPTIVIRCLPPGGGKPVACASARAGERIVLTIGKGSTSPSNVTLVPQQAPRKPTIGRATISPKKLPGSGTSYSFTLPKEWCEGRLAGQFEIQVMTSDLQNAENVRSGDADSLGFFQMRC